MLDYLPAQLPPRGVVEGVSSDAGKRIAAYQELEASLPQRKSDEQLNQLDLARAEAFGELGDDLFQKVAQEKTELLGTLKEDIARLRDHWRRLEEINGLTHWRDHGQRSYTAKPISAMSVTLGMGMSKPITGRELIVSLRTTLEKLGG